MRLYMVTWGDSLPAGRPVMMDDDHTEWVVAETGADAVEKFLRNWSDATVQVKEPRWWTVERMTQRVIQ